MVLPTVVHCVFAHRGRMGTMWAVRVPTYSRGLPSSQPLWVAYSIHKIVDSPYTKGGCRTVVPYIENYPIWYPCKYPLGQTCPCRFATWIPYGTHFILFSGKGWKRPSMSVGRQLTDSIGWCVELHVGTGRTKSLTIRKIWRPEQVADADKMGRHLRAQLYALLNALL
jgi:hypothetical protein